MKLAEKSCGTVLLPHCLKYFYRSCLSCVVYTTISQYIPSGSCCIWNLSRGLLNIPTHPCHAFIQRGIKIVCLNCYLGSVNTSGQQELKLNSPLSRAGFSSLRPSSAPHNSNRTMNLGQVLRSLVAAPSVYCCSIYSDDSDTHVEWKFPKAEEKGKD